MVEKGAPGLEVIKMENKMSMCMMQMAELKLTNVFVPDKNKLEFSVDFVVDIRNFIMATKLNAVWVMAGIASGAYEAALRYALERKQLGLPIASFQLV